MDEKKPIDRLFQEKLKDFEVFPDANVWKNIEGELTKKKRRRIVPLWLRLGSAAAVLLLLVSTGFWFFDQETPTDVSPVTEPNILEPNSPVLKESSKEPTTLDSSSENQSTNEVVNERIPTNTASTKGTAISNKSQQKYTEKQPSSQKDTPLALVESTSETAAPTETDLKISEREENNNPTTKEVIGLAETSDTAGQQNLSITKEDIANAIEDQLNEQIIDDPSLSRWSVGTAVAPVYFNTLNEGSPINPSLAGNEKQGNTSLSYGLRVNYQINDRLSLQSGVNNVELGYETQGVTALIASSELRLFDSNIDTNIDGVNLIAISNNEVAAQTSELGVQRGVVNLRGDLNQSLSYIEIPLEAKYALINNKVGVHVVGGVSTYVLYQNRIALLNQNGSTTLGEASNVNDVNFSGNLGIDLDYKINKKVFINVTPMFKYQMNTFSRNDGGFRPYYLGVYTGLNFRF